MIRTKLLKLLNTSFRILKLLCGLVYRSKIVYWFALNVTNFIISYGSQDWRCSVLYLINVETYVSNLSLNPNSCHQIDCVQHCNINTEWLFLKPFVCFFKDRRSLTFQCLLVITATYKGPVPRFAFISCTSSYSLLVWFEFYVENVCAISCGIFFKIKWSTLKKKINWVSKSEKLKSV